MSRPITKFRKNADRIFSKLVREREKYVCQRCGKQTPTAQCAHIISRRYARTRTVMENAWCLCPGCHRLVDQTAHLKMELVEATIGLERYNELWRQATDGSGQRFDWADELDRLKRLEKQ